MRKGTKAAIHWRILSSRVRFFFLIDARSRRTVRRINTTPNQMGVNTRARPKVRRSFIKKLEERNAHTTNELTTPSIPTRSAYHSSSLRNQTNGVGSDWYRLNGWLEQKIGFGWWERGVSPCFFGANTCLYLVTLGGVLKLFWVCGVCRRWGGWGSEGGGWDWKNDRVNWRSLG